MAYDENIRIIAEELERLKNRPTGDKLPEVESTDEGKVLTVNSSGEWDAEDLPDQLPEVESTDEGKVLTVNSSGKWAAATLEGGSYDITETETKTNKKLDGKDVYIREIAFSGLTVSDGQTAQILSGIDYIDKILELTVLSTDGYAPYMTKCPYVMLNAGYVLAKFTNSLTNQSGKYIIEYTKQSTTKTKKKGDK